MSRVGRMPITVPAGTKVDSDGNVFVAEGPKGKVAQGLMQGVTVEVNDGTVTVKRHGESTSERARHGLMRALLANAVKGASEGFSKVLEVVGVGYRAEVQGREVHFALGYSHPIVYKIPDGIEIEIDRQNRITVSGPDRQQVGQVSAEIRGLRRPDAYKGKGIRYAGEVLRLKVGKAGVK